MRKHPVILGIILLFIILLVFLSLIYGVAAMTGKGKGFTGQDKIAIVEIDGVIKDSTDIVENLKDFGKDDSVKGVLLRINSPGGAVAPSQEIYDAVIELRKKKRVLASMSSVAASGGYLIACASEKIIANPGTLTGSVSAVMYFANAEELMRKVGLKASSIKSGKYKDIGSPIREMTDEEKQLLQGLVDDIYSQFVEVVVRHRGIPENSIKKIADGRIFTGRQAKDLGLVDYLGDKEFAVRMLAKLTRIQGDPAIVYPKKKYGSFIDYLFEQTGSTISHILYGNQSVSVGIQYLIESHGLQMMLPVSKAN